MSEYRPESYLAINGYPVDVTIFPGGEVNVRLPIEKLLQSTIFTFTTIINNSDALLALLLSKNALENLIVKLKTCVLKLAYVPYARQDRICHKSVLLKDDAFALIRSRLNLYEIN